jgi:hypothetical protein
LFSHDPIGINFGDTDNPDEYEPETGTILPRLAACTSSDEVLQVVHQEFVRWFDLDTAGPPERYAQVALDLWQLWREYLRNREIS